MLQVPVDGHAVEATAPIAELMREKEVDEEGEGVGNLGGGAFPPPVT